MAKNFTDQQRAFAEAYVSISRETGDIKEARKQARVIAGYSDSQSWHSLFSPVVELIQELIDVELVQTTPRLLNKLDLILDQPATPGAANLMAAINSALDRAGITKKETAAVKIEAPNGVLILPAKNGENTEKQE